MVQRRWAGLRPAGWTRAGERGGLAGGGSGAHGVGLRAAATRLQVLAGHQGGGDGPQSAARAAAAAGELVAAGREWAIGQVDGPQLGDPVAGAAGGLLMVGVVAAGRAAAPVVLGPAGAHSAACAALAFGATRYQTVGRPPLRAASASASVGPSRLQQQLLEPPGCGDSGRRRGQSPERCRGS